MTSNDPTMLAEAGLLRGQGVIIGSTVKEDQALAQAVLDFCREQVGHEIASLSHYSHRPPWAFLRVLRGDHEKATTLDWMKKLWAVLQRLEADSSKIATDSLQAMMWPFNTYTREVMVGAYECDFKTIPSEAMRDLEVQSLMFGTSIMAELGHSKIVDAQRLSKGKTLGRVSKFHRVCTAEILQDHDRRVPKPLPSEKSGSHEKVTNERFTWNHDDFSLGQDALKHYTEVNPAFPNPGPAGFFKSAIATASAVAAGGDTAILSKRWLALLVEPGCFLYNRTDRDGTRAYVLSTCEHGITGWNAQPKVSDGKEFLGFRVPPGEPKWSYTFLSEIRDWYAAETKGQPPSHMDIRNADGLPEGVVCSISSKAR